MLLSRATGRHRPEADGLRQAQTVCRDCLCPASDRQAGGAPKGNEDTHDRHWVANAVSLGRSFGRADVQHDHAHAFDAAVDALTW